MTAKRSLSISQIESWMRCKRHHHNRYELGYGPKRTARAAALGTVMHKALEAWWRHFMVGGAAAAACSASLDVLHAAIPDGVDDFTLANIEALVCGYDARWGPEMADIEVLAVEVKFSGPLADPDTGEESGDFELVGVIDGIIRRGDTVWLMEHKTTSADLSPGATYWTRLRMNGQVSLYYDGAAFLGYGDVEGCIYDVIKKPTLKPLEATPKDKRRYRKSDGALYSGQRENDETPGEFRQRLVEELARRPDAYYRRAHVIRLDSELDAARWDVWNAARRIARSWGTYAPRNPDACFTYRAPCEYFAVCSGAASLDDDGQFTRIIRHRQGYTNHE